ncbi:MAG: PilZ domain-containing protein [Deltaproteobacteria bacterium]|jgi:hypothetical protein|nr:PilZ domain-containing protein [Deltaproteobacteria bacterium]
MSENTGWARANRVPIRLDTYYAYGWVEGAGVVANISYSGALIEGTPAQPDIGTPIVLHVCLHPPSAFHVPSPFELVGHVARHSTSGFAVKYDAGVNRDVRRMVDDAAAIVATRK